MIDTISLISFIAASAAIILSPGPAQALVLAVTVSNGKKAGIISVLGLNSSMIIHILAAGAGVSAVLAESAAAFTIVKFAGAGYLVYMGIMSFVISGKKSDSTITPGIRVSTAKLFVRAFLTGALNPKVALFFLAFVPQFVDPKNGWLIFQFLELGVILAVMDILYESVLVFIAGSAIKKINKNNRLTIIRQRISGSVLIALGIKMALIERK
jgi:threonine/homoserine/homoserine lactone efflux protein